LSCVSLHFFLSECVKNTSLQAKEANISVSLSISSDYNDVKLLLDKQKIAHVVRNLLSNAIKFSHSGGEVTVRVTTVSADSSCIRVDVIDHGSGISEENQKRLFKEIVQFTPGELQDGKGSGLGLWISHQIIALHEGKLYMHSDGRGFGCVFTMELPMSCVQSDSVDEDSNGIVSGIEEGEGSPESIEIEPKHRNSGRMREDMEYMNEISTENYNSEVKITRDNVLEDKSALPEDLSAEASTRRLIKLGDTSSVGSGSAHISHDSGTESVLAGARVLVVDDVAMNRKMMIRVIRNKWKDISEAEDGEVAVAAVKSAQDTGHPFDLILMDFQMPNMNGPEAAKIIMESGYRGLIIGVTGNGLPQDIKYFTSHGAHKVLLKPLKLELLDQCLEGRLK